MSGTDDPVIPQPVGDGGELFDDRALFYLHNRELIERWGGLRYDAVQAAGRWLDTLTDRVFSLRGGWSSWKGMAGSKYRALFVAPTPAPVDGPPDVAIGIAWSDAGVQPDRPGDSTSPFVGIRVNGELAHRLVPFLDAADAGQPHGYLVSSNWPRYRYITAPPRWWEHLDAYRDQLLAEAAALVERYADALDRFAGDQPRG